jgi:hypothetical protein
MPGLCASGLGNIRNSGSTMVEGYVQLGCRFRLFVLKVASSSGIASPPSQKPRASSLRFVVTLTTLQLAFAQHSPRRSEIGLNQGPGQWRSRALWKLLAI